MPNIDSANSADARTGNRRIGAGPAATVAAKLQALEQKDYPALRAEWQRLYRGRPPKRVSRDLLLLGVAWKIQEQAYGGLTAANKRRLADLAKTLDRNGDVTNSRRTHLKPGAKLVRSWGGETHVVIVLEDSFEWRGKQWRSLSAIARDITGVQWSGPRFFGLTNTGSRRSGEATGDG